MVLGVVRGGDALIDLDRTFRSNTDQRRSGWCGVEDVDFQPVLAGFGGCLLPELALIEL